MALSVSACTQQSTQPSSDEGTTTMMSAPLEIELEALKKPRVQGGMLVFGVVSFGCSKSSDFEIRAEAVDGRCRVEVVRAVRDMCKRAAEISTMRVEWTAPSDCEGLPLEFANPSLEG